jgi:hypothetical protein
MDLKQQNAVTVRKDSVVAYLLLNIALTLAISIAVISDTENAKMFSYSWTWRVGRDKDYGSMAGAGLAVHEDYRNNNDTSPGAMGTLLDRSYSAARCMPVAYDGAIQWSERQVSPTCNCIRNLHVDYARIVNPSNLQNVTGLDVNETLLMIKASVFEKCFKRVRHTQVKRIQNLKFLFF